MSESHLDQLKHHTVVVADTGDINAIHQFLPRDTTTNPTLILQAAKLPQYAHLVDSAIEHGRSSGKTGDDLLNEIMDQLAVNFGAEILKVVPGRVSTEIDARLSFDTEGSLARARKLIGMYAAAGVEKERILIKLAATWEGIKAAEILEHEGIHTNLTLIFSFAQAVACADARVTLISPFVGRILDWYKKTTGLSYSAEDDPGVISVRKIYNYYKFFDIPTIVMGASFRSADEVRALAGCDYLTISPKILEELKASSDGVLERKLSPEQAKQHPMEREHLDEKRFRFELNEDAMATEKLAEGIRNFAKDTVALADMIRHRL
eukprot:TRINITY_DN9027_c0_g1_i1.p1 TRINITY_DN9027_c0_g1~~TRINITY_DN9027_c0_g1_i1.p1  ORF type:complete len:342 (-),score=95.50 TRINITY_DN9027_c0_g1_i1:25-987(-)